MVPRYRVTLTEQERRELEALTKTGKTNAKRFLFARALLLCVYPDMNCLGFRPNEFGQGVMQISARSISVNVPGKALGCLFRRQFSFRDQIFKFFFFGNQFQQTHSYIIFG